MPRAKEYPGRLVRNKRWNGRMMHMVAKYKRAGQELGIYSDGLDQFIGLLKERINTDRQNVIVINGDTGSGKSNLAITICMELAKKLKVDFTLEDDYIYDASDIMRKLDDPDAHPISLFDEGSLLLNAKDSMGRDSKALVALFDTMRSKKWTTVICIPNIYQLNKSVRTIHADFRCLCSSDDKSLKRGFGRGFFEVYESHRNPHSKDAEPYWYLIFTGIFKPISEELDMVYQPIKARCQRTIIDNMIKKYNQNNNVEEDEEC